ncbi:hypothetical protein EOD23_16155 [Mesorhizobium sp. USDA-HM6]|nr:hypothetical protein EOD23_16155 [Mesorhizobium sp. USDA-HM6]
MAAQQFGSLRDPYKTRTTQRPHAMVFPMKTYQFGPTEFAKLEFFLGKTLGFLNRERSKAELDEFRVVLFPILRDVYYEVLGPKIDDRQREAISEADPWDNELPADKAIELLAKIFEAQTSN